MDNKETTILDFIQQGRIYRAQVGQALVVDGEATLEMVTNIVDLGSMYRIDGSDREGAIMVIRHDQVI